VKPPRIARPAHPSWHVVGRQAYQRGADHGNGQALASTGALQHVRAHVLGVGGVAVERVVLDHFDVRQKVNDRPHLLYMKQRS
jgi:hypothetical protein